MRRAHPRSAAPNFQARVARVLRSQSLRGTCARPTGGETVEGVVERRPHRLRLSRVGYDGGGKLVNIPQFPPDHPLPDARAKTFHARERYGYVWVCPGEPLNHIPDLPQEVDPAFRRIRVIFNSATAVDDGSIRLVQIVFRNDREEACSTAELVAWDKAIIEEDPEILESTDPDAIVDMSRKLEIHMPSDRPGMMMRQRLKALLQAHGEHEIPR